MLMSDYLIPQNCRSDSSVIGIGLDGLDSIFYFVPFAIQKKSIKPSLFKSFTIP